MLHADLLMYFRTVNWLSATKKFLVPQPRQLTTPRYHNQYIPELKETLLYVLTAATVICAISKVVEALTTVNGLVIQVR